MRRLLLVVVMLVGLAGTGVVPAGAANASGPALRTPRAKLDGALACPATFSHPRRPAVLLVHGTATTPEASWAWNLQQSLPDAGWDVCTVRLPNRAMGDIQVSSEYVVSAVRAMHRATGRKVSVIGHSQGTLQPRWAAKWWPDVRRTMDDLILLAGPGHGVWSASGLCVTGSCFPSAHQMSVDSQFLVALNRRSEVPAGVSVTSIYSQFDELVQPSSVPFDTAALKGASNVLIQSICPGRPVHHAGILFDPAAYALIIDALTSRGAANPSHVDASVCSQPTAPGVDLVRGAVLADGFLYADAGGTVATHPATTAEPALAAYARR